MDSKVGLEPTLLEPKSSVLPLDDLEITNLAGRVGFEPTRQSFGDPPVPKLYDLLKLATVPRIELGYEDSKSPALPLSYTATTGANSGIRTRNYWVETRYVAIKHYTRVWSFL